MDWQHWIDIICLGFIEGVTEFLPVSSSAHLILLKQLLGFEGPPGKVFEVVIQLGAIFAVALLYCKDIWNIAGSLPPSPDELRRTRPPTDQQKNARLFTFYILLAFLPAALLGAIFHQFIKDVLFNPAVVCVPMIAGGIVILIIEHFHKRETHHALTAPLSVKIGLCQCLALLPGVSRSGATILGGMLLGLTRSDATRFSFFVAIPTMLGAAAFDLYQNWSGLTDNNLYDIALGLVVAFATALFTVKWLVNFVRKHDFILFGWYRIVIGAAMLIVFLSR